MFEWLNKKSKKTLPVQDSYVAGQKPQPSTKKSSIHVITSDMSDSVTQEIRKYVSQQVTDPFLGYYGEESSVHAVRLIEPYFSPDRLDSLINTNAILKQCVTATVVNVAGNGFSLKYIGPKEDKHNEEVEKKRLNFIDMLKRPNPETDGDSFFIALAEDIVRKGYAYTEVSRNSKGDLGYIYHIPASTVRKSKKEDTGTPIDTYKIIDGSPVKVPYKKKFKQYGMKADSGVNTVYFKEFKDPRVIDKRNGKPAKSRIKRSDIANEILEFAPYEPGHVYPLPLWINQIPAILGSRLSEEVNLDFFENNAIPAMLVMVSGGGLTQESIDDLQKKFNSLKGDKSVQKILIIEATSDDQLVQMGGSIPAPKIEAKPMTHDRQNDALFRDYNKDNKESIQCSFRLPDVLLGKTADYNRATAYAAIIVAESQVFNPIRRTIECKINSSFIVDEKGLPDKHWEFRFKPTKLLNEETVFNSIKYAINSGVATPKDVADIISDNFNINIPTDVKDWAEVIPAIGMDSAMANMFNTMALSGKVINVDIGEEHFQQTAVPDKAAPDPKKVVPTGRKPKESEKITPAESSGSAE
jgi:PBSX family phage portal protein